MRFVSIVDREGVEIEFVFGKDEAKKPYIGHDGGMRGRPLASAPANLDDALGLTGAVSIGQGFLHNDC